MANYLPLYHIALTSTISVAEIWKSPNIAKTYSIAQTRQQKFRLATPISSRFIFIILKVNDHIFRTNL